MDPGPLLDRVLDDEGITSGLDEREAMALVRAVSDRVRALAAGTNDASRAAKQVNDLCRQARQIAEAVAASGTTGAARSEYLHQKLRELDRGSD
ncbi:MAG TPA: hypothetical protein VKD71_02215 [Gemmataceae bacterium]|nr:hypothetical protein [Gemmataceae bacterium]